jgi:hypothetical protein
MVLSYTYYFRFETLLLELFSIIIGVGYSWFYISLEWEKSRCKSFKKIFVVCIAGYNLSCLAYQIIQFLHSIELVFGVRLIDPEKLWHLGFTNVALSFHMILLYVRTKTVLQGMRKSLLTLNILAFVHVLCFAADFTGFLPFVQVMISVVDLYCTWIFYSFAKEMKNTIANKRLNHKRQQSIVHLQASIRLCLCSAIGGISAIVSILVYAVMVLFSQIAADVVYFLAYNVFEISFVLSGILWINLKADLRKFEEEEDRKQELLSTPLTPQDPERSIAESTATATSKDERKNPLISFAASSHSSKEGRKNRLVFF